MIKYYIKAFEADSYEDSYLEGEKSGPDSSWCLTDLHLNTRPAFDSPDEVLKYILNKNCFDEKNMKYWSRDDINAAASDSHLAEFWNSILVDENNYEASESEINDWKEGRRKLWSCQLHVTIGKVDIKELNFD